MNRKDEHVSLAKAFHSKHVTDFDAIRPIHQSFPEIAVKEVDLSTTLASLATPFPFFINAMTGGSEKTKKINQDLATIARETKLAMATGSVSAALKDPTVKDSFTIVRQTNPDGILLANVGTGTSVERAKQAIELFEADALQIHVNAPQELVMPEGDRDFTNWLALIEQITATLDVPVIVKEVGFGMTKETIQALLDRGVKTIDVSGRGGTSFTQIENARRKQREFYYLDDYGQTTAESLLEANQIQQDFSLIASGGIRHAYDIFKSLCLGADSVGLSATILNELLTHGIEDTIVFVERIKIELEMLYTMSGITKTTQATTVPLLLTGSLHDWCLARGIDPTSYATR